MVDIKIYIRAAFAGNAAILTTYVSPGSFTLGGNFNGNASGKFGMTVQSSMPTGNSLTLSGAVSGNTISGTWTLTGSSGCTGSGSFTMTKM